MLDWLTTSRAAGFVDKGTLVGLVLRATDQDWSWGSGAEIVGRSEALAMYITGRSVPFDDLSGPGVTMLRQRGAAGVIP